MEISEGHPEARTTRLRVLDVVPLLLGLAVAVAVFTYTPSKVAILCVLAALLGAMGARVERPSALLRGLVYLFVLAGLLLLGGDPMAPTQQLYVGIAGLVLLPAFLVNTRPALFARLLRRVGTRRW